MDYLAVIPIAVALAMDAFAVSIGIGVSRPELTRRQEFRVSFHFGLFQFLMPILGWWAGSRFLNIIEGVDHWAAFGLLAAIGVKMIADSRRSHSGSSRKNTDPTQGWPLLILSVATSIDALAVGLGFGILGVSILSASGLIGITALVLSYVGLKFGPLLGRAAGRRAELAGGILLILIGIRILIVHL